MKIYIGLGQGVKDIQCPLPGIYDAQDLFMFQKPVRNILLTEFTDENLLSSFQGGKERGDILDDFPDILQPGAELFRKFNGRLRAVHKIEVTP